MRLSHPKVEGVMQASKWLTHRALLDPQEMEALLSALPPFSIYNVSELIAPDSARISREEFLSKYIDYVASLKAGLLPDEKVLKPYFSAAISASSNCFYAIQATEEKCIIKPKQPVIQLGLHHFTFSEENRAFHSMVHSKQAVSWGIQFAFPQLYSNSIDNEVVEVYKNDENPNTQIFKALAKWMRKKTTPTPFKMGETPIRATFRLGKKSREWAHAHAQLKGVGLSV